MEKIYTYKLQGDGRDSWRVDEIEIIDDVEITASYMVYEDPEAKVNPAIEILKNSTPEEIVEIKRLLNL